MPRKYYSIKIRVTYLARRADIRYRKDNILADITFYGLIINIKRVKHIRILCNPQVLLVIVQLLEAGAGD